MGIEIQERRSRGMFRRIRVDSLKHDIREKGLSEEEVYDRATHRRKLTPLKSGMDMKGKKTAAEGVNFTFLIHFNDLMSNLLIVKCCELYGFSAIQNKHYYYYNSDAPSMTGLASKICCSIHECCPLTAARNCRISFVLSVFPAPDSPLKQVS